MVIFDTGELEIAVVTFNRCEFIAEWLEQCYEQAKHRNIRLSVYDSSTNSDTEDYINDFKVRWHDTDIEYYHVDSDINIGYKSMLPILNSKSKYVWVSGDSRCHDFKDLDVKVFPYLKNGVDYAVFHIVNNEENDGKIYTDKEELLRDCFLSMTCIGMSIYKTSLFEPIKCNEQLKSECDQKYKNNYAFGWIGYFLEMFAIGKHQALFTVVPVRSIKTEVKVHSWIKRCYACWIEDLCNLMDRLSEKYQCTELALHNAWKYMHLDSPGFCSYARKKGDLNKETYRKYKKNGMLERVTKQAEIFKIFSNAQDDGLEECSEQVIAIEEKCFKELCCRKIPNIEKYSKGQDLWIYGVGKGGKILRRCLKKHGVPVCGFLDRDAEKIKFCEGIAVKSIQDIKYENCFIVISLIYWEPFIIQALMERGIKRCNIFYVKVDDELLR